MYRSLEWLLTSCHGALQGPSACLVRCFWNHRDTRPPCRCAKRWSPGTKSRISDVNLYFWFIVNWPAFVVRKVGGAMAFLVTPLRAPWFTCIPFRWKLINKRIFKTWTSRYEPWSMTRDDRRWNKQVYCGFKAESTCRVQRGPLCEDKCHLKDISQNRTHWKWTGFVWDIVPGVLSHWG